MTCEDVLSAIGETLEEIKEVLERIATALEGK